MHDAFIKAVELASKPGPWSQGVKLVREGAVVLVSQTATELSVRVKDERSPVARQVTLYIEDDEWDCDCEAKISPCGHVAAAAIALRQGIAKNSDGESPRAKLAYRFSVEHTALRLDRSFVLADGTSSPLDLSLADRLARRLPEPPFEPTQEDLTVDRIMGRRIKGDVPIEYLRDVFTALSHAEDVSFDGEAVRVSSDVVTPTVAVTDVSKKAETAPRASAKEPPQVGIEVRFDLPFPRQAIVAMGVAKHGGALHALDHTDRFGLRYERLPEPRVFGEAEWGGLSGELLVELERFLPVTITSKRLPRKRTKLLPRPHFAIDQRDSAFSIMVTIVYGDPPVARVDGQTLVTLGAEVPVRDEARERRLATQLRDELSLLPGRRMVFEGKDAAKMVERLERFAEPREDTQGELGALTSMMRTKLAPRAAWKDGLLDVWLEAETDDSDTETPRRASLAAAYDAFREGLRIVPLEGGGFAPLPADFLARHGALVADLLAARAEGEKAARSAKLLAVEVARALDLPIPSALEHLRPLLETGEPLPTPAWPDGIEADLRPYQRDGVNWLLQLRALGLGGLLADDMGLGKTLQTIVALAAPALVICPKSVVHNWEAEIRRFRPALTVARYEGTHRTVDESADVILTTHSLVRIDLAALSAKSWATIVVDEAQAIKNPESQLARAITSLTGEFRVALTGTPIENRLEELWSIMRFVNPGLLGTRSNFLDRYARPIEEGNTDALAALKKRSSSFVLRRRKSEVLKELPPRTEALLTCELTEDERASYDAVRAAARTEVAQKLSEGRGALAALEALLRLRQAACHTGLLPRSTPPPPSSSKVECLMESLETLAAEGHKALVFSQWTSFLDLIEPHLDAASLPFTRLDGSTRDRESVVADFSREEGPPVMLLSLKAGGTGLNLTHADHVFLMDPWWNPAVEEQAMDRAHRIGQDRPVMVYRLIAKDTVEERVFALKERKQALSRGLLDGGDLSVGAITESDLLALLD